jgi:hypothetical protein
VGWGLWARRTHADVDLVLPVWIHGGFVGGWVVCCCECRVRVRSVVVGGFICFGSLYQAVLFTWIPPGRRCRRDWPDDKAVFVQTRRDGTTSVEMGLWGSHSLGTPTNSRRRRS